MSGPFSLLQTEQILQGPVYCSPFIVAEQDQGPGLPSKFHVCPNLSKDDPVSGMGSVNSFISKDDFPTCFDMACHVAEVVSCSPTYPILPDCTLFVVSLFYSLIIWAIYSHHLDVLLSCHLDNLLSCHLDHHLDNLLSCHLHYLLFHHLDVLLCSSFHIIYY